MFCVPNVFNVCCVHTVRKCVVYSPSPYVEDLKSTDSVNEQPIVLLYITSFTPQFKI